MIAQFNPIQTYSTISDLPNIVYTGSNTIAEMSLKILELAINNVQRYIKLSTTVDEKLHQDSTVLHVQYKHTAQSLMYKSIYVLCSLII